MPGLDSPDTIGTIVAAILTLMVYSYLVRDNPLYRVAEHLLVATTVAYGAIAAFHYVLLPRLLNPLVASGGARTDLYLPLLLGFLLLAKALPGVAWLGNLSVAYLIGIGVGLAVGGALLGTLLPQVRATFLPILPFGGTDLGTAISNLIIIAGTLVTLLSFRLVTGSGPNVRESAPEGYRTRWSVYGQWFVMLAFGAFLGGSALTYLSLLIGRMDFLINDVIRRLAGF